MGVSPSPGLRAALAGMFTMAIVMGIGRFVYTPLLPLMAEAGAFDAAEAGFVAGANYLGYLIGALLASLAVFIPQRRFWAFAGLVASVATTAALAAQPGIAAMALIRFTSGLASAFAMIFATSIVMRRLALEGRPGLVAGHFAGVGVGIALSAMLVSALATNGVEWPQIWLAAAALALAMLVAVRVLMPGPLASGGISEAQEKVGGRFSRVLWLCIAGYGFFGFGYVISATFINAMAQAEPALHHVLPWVWIVVGLSAIPSVWIWNRAAASVGLARAYAIACLVEAAGVGLPVFLATPASLIVSASLLGGTFVAITALGLTHSRALAPENPSRAIALMTAAFGLGQMIGPVAAGILFERSGNLDAAFLIAAVALALAAIFSVGTEWSWLRSEPAHRQ